MTTPAPPPRPGDKARTYIGDKTARTARLVILAEAVMAALNGLPDPQPQPQGRDGKLLRCRSREWELWSMNFDTEQAMSYWNSTDGLFEVELTIKRAPGDRPVPWFTKGSA